MTGRGMTMRVFRLLFLAGLVAVSGNAMAASAVTPVPSPCTITTTATAKTDYSATVGGTSVTLIPAAPTGVTRTGVFIQLLTPSASLGVNPSGGTASLTSAGNMVVATQYAGFNFASMGFVPQGAITAIADSSGRAVTAYACPR
jgi:hypothetical protein